MPLSGSSFSAFSKSLMRFFVIARVHFIDAVLVMVFGRLEGDGLALAFQLGLADGDIDPGPVDELLIDRMFVGKGPQHVGRLVKLLPPELLDGFGVCGQRFLVFVFLRFFVFHI